MTSYVIDTSVAAKLFLEEEDQDIAFEVFRQANKKRIQLLAPGLIFYELNNTLVCQGFTDDEIYGCLSLFHKQVQKKVLKIVSHSLRLLRKAEQIALIDTQGQGYISSYDATFHALALLRNATFLTADRKHYNKTLHHVGSVCLLADFT